MWYWSASGPEKNRNHRRGNERLAKKVSAEWAHGSRNSGVGFLCVLGKVTIVVVVVAVRVVHSWLFLSSTPVYGKAARSMAF